MFEIVSSLLKYAFAIIIYLFILNIMRLIFLDIRSMSERGKAKSASGSCLKLLSTQGAPDYKVEEFYPLIGDASIGRMPVNTICLADAFLTETHAILKKKRKTYYLKDNRSLNGTYLNGKRLGAKPVRLRDGDRIIAGRTEFLYVKDKRRGNA